jgi:hypothetical protein
VQRAVSRAGGVDVTEAFRTVPRPR